MKAFIFPLVFYFMALMGLCLEFLPESCFAIFGEMPEGDTSAATLGLVVITGGAGVVLHWLLYRRNPERFDHVLMAKVGGAMFVSIAALFVASALLSMTTGASPDQLKESADKFMSTLGLLVVAATLLLVVGAGIGILVTLRFHPLNRMSRQLQAENYQAAIAIGEAALRRSDDAGIRYNLAVAYAADGRLEQARAIYDDLATMDATPKPFSEQSFAEALEFLRPQVEQSDDSR